MGERTINIGRLRNGRQVLSPELVPVHLLPLLKWLEEEPKDGVFFIERGGLITQAALALLSKALGLAAAPSLSGLIRRPSKTRNNIGALLRQLLSDLDIARRLDKRRVSRIAHACKDPDTRATTFDLISPGLCEILDVLTEKDPSRELERLQIVNQIFLKPSGPFLTAAFVNGLSLSDDVTNALRSDARLAHQFSHYAEGLRRVQLSPRDLDQRLAGRPIDADSLAMAFTDLFIDALERCRFSEEEALRVALENSAVERAFAPNLLFIDDRIGAGETYIVLSMLYQLYHPDSVPCLYTLCTDYPSAVRAWQVPLKVGSSSAVVLEDVPQYLDSFWEWKEDRYYRIGYIERSGDCSLTLAKWKGDLIRRGLADAERKAAAPIVFQRLPTFTKLKLIESVLLQRCSNGQLALWEAFEADLFYNWICTDTLLRELPLEKIVEDVSCSYAWLRYAVPTLPPSDRKRFVASLTAECCASWGRDYDYYCQVQLKRGVDWLTDESRCGEVARHYLGRKESHSWVCSEDDSAFSEVVRACRLVSERLESLSSVSGVSDEST
jgi:hypothetical protein